MIFIRDNPRQSFYNRCFINYYPYIRCRFGHPSSIVLAASIRVGLNSTEALPRTVNPSLSSTSTSAPCLIRRSATCQTHEKISQQKHCINICLPTRILKHDAKFTIQQETALVWDLLLIPP